MGRRWAERKDFVSEHRKIAERRRKREIAALRPGLPGNPPTSGAKSWAYVSDDGWHVNGTYIYPIYSNLWNTSGEYSLGPDYWTIEASPSVMLDGSLGFWESHLSTSMGFELGTNLTAPSPFPGDPHWLRLSVLPGHPFSGQVLVLSPLELLVPVQTLNPDDVEFSHNYVFGFEIDLRWRVQTTDPPPPRISHAFTNLQFYTEDWQKWDWGSGQFWYDNTGTPQNGGGIYISKLT